MPRPHRKQPDQLATTGLNDLAALLAQANAQHADEVPSGWLTTKQWAARWNCKLAWATQCLARFRQANMVEVRHYRVHAGGRGVIAVAHYFFHATPTKT